ncbi:Rid family hydrolase [Streptomyces sp. LHD-70]|uniref:Rid family hydrolase n=1 Tax=Streptomyces sp. LHD-70 TaxID=3072140 RepID=UPI00280E1851|nr:Rid family hydrolase [Streptomyces sp. LHD-70]MDQ8706944.1 Rid family hydrolase [Streptomyces sp. LHD-70]
MARRSVLLIGWRPEAIEALERHGAEVTCVLATRDDTPRRAALLDDAHTVPVQDPTSAEETLAGLERCGLSVTDFDVVCSQHEYTLVNASVLGGPRSPTTPRAALALRDKDLQKRRIRDAGLAAAEARAIVHTGQLRDVPHTRGVIKPLADSGTRGVLSWRNEAERHAVADLLERADAQGPCLTEEWVDGAELHIDGVVRGGQVLFVSVGRYLQNVLSIRDGGIVATVMEHPGHRTELYDRAHTFAEQAMKALEHHDGVFHLEVFEQPDRFVFGECGGRIPGGSFDEMIRRQHGVDLHDEWARAVLGLPPGVAPRPDERWLGDVFLATEAGRLRDFPDEREVAERDGVEHVVLTARVGGTSSEATEASNRPAGTAVLAGADAEQTALRIRELAAWFAARTVVAPGTPQAPDPAGQKPDSAGPGSALTHVSAPAGVAPSDGYTHVVTGPGQVAAVAGQMPFDEKGVFVGTGDPAAQARQVFRNMRGCLAAAGLTFDDVIKLTYYVTDIAHVPQVLAVRDEFVSTERPPASTVVQVVALYRPDLLLEIDALALVPQS